MFANTSGHVDWGSLSDSLDSAWAVHAQPCCIFSSGYDAASPHFGARSRRARWMVFLQCSFREAGRVVTRPSLLATRSPEGQVNGTQRLEAKEVPWVNSESILG